MALSADQDNIHYDHHLVPRLPPGLPINTHLLHFVPDELFIPQLADGELCSNSGGRGLNLS